MIFGITGLAKTGKTTMFNLLTGSELETGKFTASLEEVHRALAHIPDDRVERLAGLMGSKKTVYAGIDFMDFAGLSLGGERESKLVGELRTIDALVHSVRAFEDDEIPHSAGKIDPRRDAANFLSELIINDQVVAENRMEKIESMMGKAKTDDLVREKALIERVIETLESSTPLREMKLDSSEEFALRGFGFLSLKPLLFALNVSEDMVDDLDNAVEKWDLAEIATMPGVKVCPVCAKIEEELCRLEDDERSMFMEDLGLTDLACDRLMKAAFRLLDFITFYTATEKETRAWTLCQGCNALKAAETIHTDIARGFIRAEVANADALLEAGSLAEARNRGLLHLEGKEYIVKDRDYIHIRFNV
jgi:GTP-binding protein YchF